MPSPFLFTPAFERAVEQALSPATFDAYRPLTRTTAFTDCLDLYTANTALSEALLGPMQTVEVAVRTAIRARLQHSFGVSWFRSGVLDFPPQSDSARALATLTLRYQQRKGHDGSPLYPTDEALGAVISNELTLGFWCSLFDKSFEELWRHCLRHAFPHVGRGLTRKEVSRRLHEIRRLRNRIAHHEQIVRYDLLYHYNAIVELMSFLNPIAAVWMSHHNRFQAVYREWQSLLPNPDQGPRSN